MVGWQVSFSWIFRPVRAVNVAMAGYEERVSVPRSVGILWSVPLLIGNLHPGCPQQNRGSRGGVHCLD